MNERQRTESRLDLMNGRNIWRPVAWAGRQANCGVIPQSVARGRALSAPHHPDRQWHPVCRQPRNRDGWTARYRIHRFDQICNENGIEHRLTKPNHPWTNGQVERMNRTIKEATVKRYHYDSHDQLRQHLQLFIDAYNYGRRLKTLKGLTPFEYVARIWIEEPDRFKIDPYHHSAGLTGSTHNPLIAFRRYDICFGRVIFMMMFLALVPAASLAAASADTAVPAPTEPPKKERLVCRTDDKIGSRLGGKRVC
jgi:hypothetical protein